MSGNEYAGNKIEGEINNYIWESRIDLGLNTENDFYDFIDSVIDFQKLYFNAKADVDFSAAKLQDEKYMSESIGSVALDANFKVVALDVNKIIATSAGIQSVDLPVKTIWTYQVICCSCNLCKCRINHDCYEFIFRLNFGS